MIVGSNFDGDGFDPLKWGQHDMYRDALGLIIETCRRHYLCAARIVPTSDCATLAFLRADFSTDHRTLQAAHDHLAGYWRYKNGHTQPDFGFEGDVPMLVDQWLHWLKQEVESWAQRHPELVVMVCGILVNQNTDEGYAFEGDLIRFLRSNYAVS